MMEQNTTRPIQYWAIVPAAGIGSRMGSDIPKQYLSLHGHTILEQTLNRLATIPGLSGIVVAIAKNDPHWAQQKLPVGLPVQVVEGGEERRHSVCNALEWISTHVGENVWVLVHDAARPCIRVEDVLRLVKTVNCDPHGGLLAVPVRDTVKRSADMHIAETVDRKSLWCAQTPQYFPLPLLRQALRVALEKNIPITDDAQAMELLGYQPRLVKGSDDNIKITRPGDIALAEFYLNCQQRTAQQSEVNTCSE